MPRRDLLELLERVADWGEETFPGSTDRGRLTHLGKEFRELIADPSSGEEMADMLMILSHQARAHGVDLFAAIEAKFAVCLTREWGPPDADGVVEHVR